MKSSRALVPLLTLALVSACSDSGGGGGVDAPGGDPATWSEARKMFRKSPYLDRLPVLSLQPEQLSRYRLRRSTRDDHFCTAEVAALCLALAGEHHAAQTLEAYLDVFTRRYLLVKQQLPLLPADAVDVRLAVLAKTGAGATALAGA